MKIVFLSAFCFFCFTQTCYGKVYYVNIDGNDITGDGSVGKAWRTIKHSVSQVPEAQEHEIRISAGTFVEQGPINVPHGVNITGSGKTSTIVMAVSSFYYSPPNPGYSLDKYLFRLESSSSTDGDQALKDFKINGDGKKVHGGIYVRNRNNLHIENVEVEEVNFNGIWLWDIKNSTIKDISLINCAWGSTDYVVGALNIGNLDGVIFDNLFIDEDRGYGIKAIGPSGVNNIFNTKIINSHISVTPIGLWNEGSASNIAIELWQVDLMNNEIRNCYVDNNISLVNNLGIPPRGTPTIRLYENIIDLDTRADGHGYGVELTVHDIEIDHNYFIRGNYGMANWGNTMQNWNIHHNIFYNIYGTYPGEILRSQWSGMKNVQFFHNTVEFDSGKTTSVIGIYNNGTGYDVSLRNNLFINSNTSYDYYPTSLIFLEGSATISNLIVEHNVFKDLPFGDEPGTYSNNLIVDDPMIKGSGIKPEPYYTPLENSPLIDSGMDIGLTYSGDAPDIGAY